LGGDGTNGITLTKQNNVLSFDIPIETPKGIVYAMYVRGSEVAAPALSTTMSIEKAHKLLGHQSEDATRKMAKNLGWTLTKGHMSPCLPCTIGKAKQKITIKESARVSSKNPGERVFTDIASIRPAN
jgi:hypothetical protein